ncbi:signal transduction histidine kinase [Povalibacter uvarum]|uniref:histidine kinase n=1 Tax=Povalibacter uvarum TaxID=732238 RepID=A0A841HKG0_9GAMM|nr:ATP-binding protein [Povalibacter uvarum]MBB6092869.1 signal transduction histidine kinase [Povalibacter uvarum]
MLSRLQEFIDRIQLDTSRASLGFWIAAINVLIVILVVGGISISAIGSLRDLADQQGKSRVQLAGAMAREDLRRFGEDALTHAKSVAERATLQRLLADRQAAAIGPYLRRSCNTDTITACAVFEGRSLVAQAGVALPWAEIAQATTEQGERFLAVPTNTGSAVLGASAQVGGATERRVFVARLMDEKLGRLLSDRVGLGIHLISYRTFVNNRVVDDFTRLHSAGLSDGRSAVARIGDADLYAASFPIFASTGEAIALLEARLPAGDIDKSTGSLVKRLIITAIVLAALAVLAGVILGQQVTGPVSTLTEAAERLGHGDFSTSIPVGGTKEVGKLGRTMEDMRNNLVELTGALRRREAEAQAVLGGIVEGVYAVDKSRVIRYLNPQAARLLGVQAHEAIGRFCGDVLKPCAENGMRPCENNCPILHARSEGSAQSTERLNLREGTPRTTIITSAAPVDDLQVQVIRDETELEGVRRARDSVLANISHEFRTPLAAQLASIELLREGMDTMSVTDQKELVLSLERGALRLTRLIDNLLESVRIESGQLGIRHQSVAIAEIVEDADALIGALLKQRRQTLVLDIPEDLPRVDGDGPRLTQVFVNLLANASKFAPEDSTVRIGASATGHTVTTWVEDEGAGVPEIESGSIFERFYRGPDQEPEPGGLGLGLWIVKSIINRHEGSIHAERREGRTRFVVELMQAKPE